MKTTRKMTTTKFAEIETTARAKFFRGCPVETRRIRIESDGCILVWDDIAGHFTRVHSLSVHASRRILREAMQALRVDAAGELLMPWERNDYITAAKECARVIHGKQP